MNIKVLSNFFFSYDHVFTNYFLGKKRTGVGYLWGGAMLNSLAVIYASYYPELDLSIYRSTQRSLRLLFGLNSLDDVLLRGGALGIKVFLSKTSDSWYLKYGHNDLLPLRTAITDATYTFSRNGLFHRLLFDEYRVQFRKTWLQKQNLGSPDLSFIDSSLDWQYTIFREKNPYLFLNTRRFMEPFLFESQFGDRFYKAHELRFENHSRATRHEAILETYLTGRQHHEKLRTAGLTLDVRFKHGFEGRAVAEAARRGFYYFCCTFNKLVLVDYLGFCVQNVSWWRHLLSRLLVPSFLPGRFSMFYSWLNVITNISKFSKRCGVLYRLGQIYKLASLSQKFCYVNTQICVVFVFTSLLRVVYNAGLLGFMAIPGFSFVRGELNVALRTHFFRSYFWKLCLSITKFKSIFDAKKYLFFSKIRIVSYNLNKIVAMTRRCFLAISSMCLSLTFLKTRRFGFLLSMVNRFINLLALAEFRLNNLYAFRIFTQLAVGYPGLYLPDTKYERIFANIRLFFRNILIQKNSIMRLRRKLVFKKLRITSSLLVICRETLIFTELFIQNFTKRWRGLQSTMNVLSNSVYLHLHMFFSLVQLFRLMFVVNSNGHFVRAVKRNSDFSLVFETMPDLRVLLNTSWALSNGILQQTGLNKALYSARFSCFNLKYYHKILATKIDKLYSSVGFVSESSDGFILEKIATASRANDFFRQFARVVAISATPNLSAALQLNYGRSGILNVFRNVGVADYSQFFNIYVQNEIANFSLTRHSLLSDAEAVRIHGSANYMFFDGLSKAFFASELRDQYVNFSVNLAIVPYETPLFFSEHLKLGGFLNVFDYCLSSVAVHEPVMYSAFSVNYRYFVFAGNYCLYMKKRATWLCWTRNSRYSGVFLSERNLILRKICDALLKI